MNDNKRKFEELIAIYTFENELGDIYVEGPTDKLVIENFLEYKRLNTNVIEINTIDFTDIQQKFNDLDYRSNKDKLIALSRVINQINTKCNIKCIVDRDFDGIINPLEKNKILYYTDYSCIESYFLSKKHIEKLLKIGIRNFPHSSEIIIGEISKVLTAMFILRYVNKHFNLDNKLPKLDNCMVINKKTGTCTFSLESYIITYINTNKLKSKSNDILIFIEKLKKLIPNDVRYSINGHDFVEVLFNYINKIKNTPNFRLENFEKAVFLAIQPDHLEEYFLFKKLES